MGVQGQGSGTHGRGISWSQKPHGVISDAHRPAWQMCMYQVALYLLSGCTVPSWTKTVWPFAVVHDSGMDGTRPFLLLDKARSPLRTGHVLR